MKYKIPCSQRPSVLVDKIDNKQNKNKQNFQNAR